jgi:methylglyoxal/glyoxal reductase
LMSGASPAATTAALSAAAALRATALTLSNGLPMPRVGYGTYMRQDDYAGVGGVRAAVARALAMGYRHLDCASFYANEKEVGAAIAASGVPRAELFVTGKVWNDAQGYARTRASFERSLRDLGVGYFDCFLVHWPLPGVFVETYRALEDLHKEGKCRSIGLSNFTVEDYAELARTMTVAPVCNQIEVNPLLYRKDTIEFFQKKGIAVVAYKPLRAAACVTHPTVVDIAARSGGKLTAGQVCLRWGLQKGLSVVPKSSNPGRMAENLNVLAEDQALSDADMAALDGLMCEEMMGKWREHYESRKWGSPPPGYVRPGGAAAAAR